MHQWCLIPNLMWCSTVHTNVVFTSSFAEYLPVSTASWFSGFKSLTTITGIENLKTDSVKSMRSMFQGCASLIHVDMSQFNTSKVSSSRSSPRGTGRRIAGALKTTRRRCGAVAVHAERGVARRMIAQHAGTKRRESAAAAKNVPRTPQAAVAGAAPSR